MKKFFEMMTFAFDLQLFAGAPNTQTTASGGLTDEMKVYYSDYLIDLGPEGGKAGGQLVFAGTPEEIIHCEASYTGRFLQDKMQ